MELLFDAIPNKGGSDAHRFSILRYFFNGWFTKRRFQKVGLCRFCSQAHNLPRGSLIAARHLTPTQQREDSLEHIRECRFVTSLLLAEGAIDTPSPPWAEQMASAAYTVGVWKCKNAHWARQERDISVVFILACLYSMHTTLMREDHFIQSISEGQRMFKQAINLCHWQSKKKKSSRKPARRRKKNAIRLLALTSC